MAQLLTLWSETFVAFYYNVRRHYATCLTHVHGHRSKPVIGRVPVIIYRSDFIGT